ncbi:major facilitator superfamily domain-containing protein [Phascolomyces articulosus]|uniref:Major facilitator superfamily domain-containing protein n=1 Tax=Phascolomyces articulosus TaxID=60185 RepID=A0AAD5JXD9_9FUNG|nr:major facilitator superfamily domain-containing protein [Phascolomyces articulosus]
MRSRNYMTIDNNNFNGGKHCEGQSSQEGHGKDTLLTSCSNGDSKYRKEMVVNHIPVDEEAISLHLPPVDGKRAWIVVIGLFLVTIFNGVMQEYYLRAKLFPEENLVMWLTFVGVLFEVFFRFFIFLGNIIYPLIGFKLVLILGITMMVGGLILSSLATSIWQLYLTYSLCCGTGAAVLTLTGYRILPQWFTKRLSTASGVFSASLGFGGIVLPPFTNRVNEILGPIWTYRILALIIFVCGLIGFSCIKERKATSLSKGNDNQKKRRQSINDMFGFDLLKNTNLVLWITMGPIYLCVVCIKATFIPSSVTAIGLSDVDGALAVTVSSIAGITGSIIIGILADKFGNLNIFIICTVIAALSVFLLWMMMHSLVGLMAFCVIHGLSCPAFFTVSTSVLISIVGREDYPKAVGLRALVTIFSIIGPFIATYLETLDTGMEPYFYCKFVSGAGYTICALLGLVIKLRMNPKLLAKI